MLPVLYETTETTFTTNGICRLSDCISCFVTEERNGIYECEFTYPVSGSHFNDIQLGRIVACTHDDYGDVQPFTIYSYSEPIDGVVTFFAHHISYELNAVTCAPFTATGCTNAIAGLKTNSYTANRFTFTTDIVSSTKFNLEAPTPVRSAMGGIEGSILDTFGGEYKFDKFNVTLYASRGSNSGVSIRYAKNLVDYTDEVDYSETYNGVIPFWTGTDDNDETTVIANAVVSQTSTFTGRDRVIPYDFSDQFESKPTTSQLTAAAQSFLASETPWLPDRNIEIEFAALWQMDEYKEYAAVERVKLCDTVQVVFPAYSMSGTMKVVSVTYNVLADRYDKIELGKLHTTLDQAINASVDGKIKEIDAVSRGALQIAGNTNQYFWFWDTIPAGADQDIGTGAHITETPKAEFVADPTNGGGNLLARSNGIAVRDGLTELAIFGADGARIGEEGETSITITPDTIEGRGEGGKDFFSFANSGATLDVTKTRDIKSNAPLSELTSISETIPETPKNNTHVTTKLQVYNRQKTQRYANYVFDCRKGTAKQGSTTFTIDSTSYTFSCSYNGDTALSFALSPSPSSAVEAIADLTYSYVVEELAPSFRFGGESTVTGGYSLVAGYGNSASNDYSFACGLGNRTYFAGGATVGRYSATVPLGLFVVGMGTSDENRENALVVNNIGDILLKADANILVAITALGWENDVIV